ncbi:hypothetical protein QTP88_028623 [Uroleucon formosanum]
MVLMSLRRSMTRQNYAIATNDTYYIFYIFYLPTLRNMHIYKLNHLIHNINLEYQRSKSAVAPKPIYPEHSLIYSNFQDLSHLRYTFYVCLK